MCTCSFVPLHDYGLNYHLDTLHLHSTWKIYVIIFTILYGIQIILVFRIIFQRHLLWSRTGVLGNCGPFTVWVSKLCYAATFPQHRRCNGLMTWGKRYSVSVFSERNNGKNPLLLGWQVIFFWRVAKWSPNLAFGGGKFRKDSGLGVGRLQRLGKPWQVWMGWNIVGCHVLSLKKSCFFCEWGK